MNNFASGFAEIRSVNDLNGLPKVIVFDHCIFQGGRAALHCSCLGTPFQIGHGSIHALIQGKANLNLQDHVRSYSFSMRADFDCWFARGSLTII